MQLHRGSQPGLQRQEKQAQSRRNCCSPHQRTTAVVCISCRDAGRTQLWQIWGFFALQVDARGQVLALLDKTTTVVFWWHWLLFATRIWCSPGFLLCRIYVASLNSPEELKSGRAISPENESYSWSLHQTVQSLQESSQLFWKLLNSRDEDRSVFLPQPCHRIALDMSLGSHLNFPLGSLWPETCTKNCPLWMRYLTLNPQSKNQIHATAQTCFFTNESKIFSKEQAVSVV